MTLPLDPDPRHVDEDHTQRWNARRTLQQPDERSGMVVVYIVGALLAFLAGVGIWWLLFGPRP